MNYEVHMVSFQNQKEKNAYSTLMRNQEALDWQIELLEQFLQKLKMSQSVSEFI